MVAGMRTVPCFVLGLALAACGQESSPPQASPASQEEAAAIADAEAMISENPDRIAAPQESTTEGSEAASTASE